MCSHENITWRFVPNTVKNRMVENSLMQKFTASRRLRRRTKVLNAEMKHCRVKNYSHYVTKRTTVLRRLEHDTDTDDTDNLSDVDYTILYKSELKLKKYVANKSKIYNHHSSETDEDMKEKDKHSNGKLVIKKPKEHVNSSLQKITKNKKLTVLSDRNQCTDILHSKQGNSQDDKYNSKTCSTNQSFSLKLNSDIVSYARPMNESIMQNHRELNTISSELNSQSDSLEDKTSCKMKHVDENTMQRENLNTMINQSNSALDLHDDTVSCKEKHMSKTTTHSDGIIRESNFISNFPNKVSNQNKSASKVIIQNCESSNAMLNETNFEVDSQNSTEFCTKFVNMSILKKQNENSHKMDKISESESNLQDAITYETKSVKKKVRKLNEIANELNCSLNLENSSNGTLLSRSISLENDNHPFSFTNESESNRLKDCNTEKVMQNNKNSKNPHNFTDVCISRELLNNVKRNLISTLRNIDRANDNKDAEKSQSEADISHCSQLSDLFSSDALSKFSSTILSLNQHKDSGIEDDSQEKYIKSFCIKHGDNTNNITEKVVLSSKFKENDKLTKTVKNCTTDINLKTSNNIKQDSVETIEVTKGSLQVIPFSEDDMNPEINTEDKTHFIITDELSEIKKKHLQLKIMSTEKVYKKYKIVNDTHNNTNIKEENTFARLNILTNCLSVTDNNVKNVETKDPENTTMYEETISTWFKEKDNAEEEDEKEDNIMNYVSSRMKKRLQQQARLNLIVDSDFSESDNKNENYAIIENSKSYIDSSDASCGETERNENGKRKREESNADILFDKYVFENICTHTDRKSKNDTNIDEDIYTSGNEKLKTYRRDSTFEKRYISSSDKENVSNQNNQHHKENTCTVEKQNIVPCRYRPCNLQELVEEQELLIKTLSASFTLQDISEDEEIFFLNIPNKLLECDLQNQQILLEENTIKFGKTTYKVTRKNIDAVSCVFATGKRRKPYKTVNVKDVSTVTIRERLPCQMKKLTKFHDTAISFKSKLKRHHSNLEMEDQEMDRTKRKTSL